MKSFEAGDTKGVMKTRCVMAGEPTRHATAQITVIFGEELGTRRPEGIREVRR